MSYLQRLLDAGPSMSVTPGNVVSSPIALQDQRLGEFPTLTDPFLPNPAQEMENPPPDIAANADIASSPAPSKEDGLKLSLYPPPVVAPEVTSDRVETPSLDPVTIENTRELQSEPHLRSDPDEGVLAQNANTAEPDVIVTTALSPILRPQPDDTPPHNTDAVAPPPGLWPIPQADFQPLEIADPVPTLEISDQQSPAPLKPSVEAVSEQGAPVASARNDDVPSLPLTPVPVVTPAIETSPSPLIGVPEAAPSVPEAAAPAPPPAAKLEMHRVERVVETPSKNEAPPPAMTAASASVIGPISIGGMGLRERRARGWG